MKALILLYSNICYGNIMLDMPFWIATFSGMHVKQELGVPVVCEPTGMLFKVHMVSNCYKIVIHSSELWYGVTGFLIFGNSIMAWSSRVWRFVNITECYWTHLCYSLAPHIDLVDNSWCWLIQAPTPSSCTHSTFNQSQLFAVPQVLFSYFIIIWTVPELNPLGPSYIITQYPFSESHHYTQVHSTAHPTSSPPTSAVR